MHRSGQRVTIAQGLRTAGDALPGQMFGDRCRVERIDPQAQVIEVGPAGARCAASRPGLVGWHDVLMFIHEAFRGKIEQDPRARFPVRMSLGVKRAPVARRPAVLKVRS